MDKAKQVKEDLRQRLLQRIHAISPTAESIFAGLAGDRKWRLVKNFSMEAGYSEQLTELDILFMAAVYETEKKTIGIDHINRIPLLDVHGAPLIECRNHAILRALVSFEKWAWMCVLSPVCISVFPVVVVVEMGVSIDTYPFCTHGRFFHLPWWHWQSACVSSESIASRRIWDRSFAPAKLPPPSKWKPCEWGEW